MAGRHPLHDSTPSPGSRHDAKNCPTSHAATATQLRFSFRDRLGPGHFSFEVESL